MTNQLHEVSRDRFFQYVEPRDIIVSSDRAFTTWETRNRVMVGRTVPGYMPVHQHEEKKYFLTESALSAAVK